MNEYKEKNQTNNFEKENEELKEKLQNQKIESDEKIQVSFFLFHFTAISFFF
jgi:hypothetical protein